VCICSLIYLACKALASYYIVMWFVWLYHIFPKYLINATIFGRNLFNMKCVFWFPQQLLSEEFLILRTIQRGTVINTNRSLCKVTVFLDRFQPNLNLKYKISWKSVLLEPIGYLRTDGQTDMWRNYESLFAVLRTCLITRRRVRQWSFSCNSQTKFDRFSLHYIAPTFPHFQQKLIALTMC
jgi:hypothetical protein